MRKSMWLAATAVIATVAVTAGGTYALFNTATPPSSKNFTAGTLCLTSDRNDGDTVPGPMFYVTSAQGATVPGNFPGAFPTGPWAPGDMNTRTLTVNNPTSCSSMNAWLTTVKATAHAGSDVALADKLMVEIWTPKAGVDVKVGEGPLSQFLAGPVSITYADGTKIPVLLTANRHMKFKVKFDLTADNSYQDKTMVVDFAVSAVQQNHNP